MTLLATLVRALASLPRRHRCVHGCGERFHSVQAMGTHLWVDHYGEPAPKKEHAR